MSGVKKALTVLPPLWQIPEDSITFPVSDVVDLSCVIPTGNTDGALCGNITNTADLALFQVFMMMVWGTDRQVKTNSETGMTSILYATPIYSVPTPTKTRVLLGMLYRAVFAEGVSPTKTFFDIITGAQLDFNSAFHHGGFRLDRTEKTKSADRNPVANDKDYTQHNFVSLGLPGLLEVFSGYADIQYGHDGDGEYNMGVTQKSIPPFYKCVDSSDNKPPVYVHVDNHPFDPRKIFGTDKVASVIRRLFMWKSNQGEHVDPVYMNPASYFYHTDASITSFIPSFGAFADQNPDAPPNIEEVGDIESEIIDAGGMARNTCGGSSVVIESMDDFIVNGTEDEDEQVPPPSKRVRSSPASECSESPDGSVLSQRHSGVFRQNSGYHVLGSADAAEGANRQRLSSSGRRKIVRFPVVYGVTHDIGIGCVEKSVVGVLPPGMANPEEVAKMFTPHFQTGNGISLYSLCMSIAPDETSARVLTREREVKARHDRRNTSGAVKYDPLADDVFWRSVLAKHWKSIEETTNGFLDLARVRMMKTGRLGRVVATSNKIDHVRFKDNLAQHLRDELKSMMSILTRPGAAVPPAYTTFLGSAVGLENKKCPLHLNWSACPTMTMGGTEFTGFLMELETVFWALQQHGLVYFLISAARTCLSFRQPGDEKLTVSICLLGLPGVGKSFILELLDKFSLLGKPGHETISKVVWSTAAASTGSHDIGIVVSHDEAPPGFDIRQGDFTRERNAICSQLTSGVSSGTSFDWIVDMYGNRERGVKPFSYLKEIALVIASNLPLSRLNRAILSRILMFNVTLLNRKDGITPVMVKSTEPTKDIKDEREARIAKEHFLHTVSAIVGAAIYAGILPRVTMHATDEFFRRLTTRMNELKVEFPVRMTSSIRNVIEQIVIRWAVHRLFAIPGISAHYGKPFKVEMLADIAFLLHDTLEAAIVGVSLANETFFNPLESIVIKALTEIAETRTRDLSNMYPPVLRLDAISGPPNPRTTIKGLDGQYYIQGAGQITTGSINSLFIRAKDIGELARAVAITNTVTNEAPGGSIDRSTVENILGDFTRNKIESPRYVAIDDRGNTIDPSDATDYTVIADTRPDLTCNERVNLHVLEALNGGIGFALSQHGVSAISSRPSLIHIIREIVQDMAMPGEPITLVTGMANPEWPCLVETIEVTPKVQVNETLFGRRTIRMPPLARRFIGIGQNSTDTEPRVAVRQDIDMESFKIHWGKLGLTPTDEDVHKWSSAGIDAQFRKESARILESNNQQPINYPSDIWTDYLETCKQSPKRA